MFLATYAMFYTPERSEAMGSKFEEHAGLSCSSSVPRSTVSAIVTILLLTFGR